MVGECPKESDILPTLEATFGDLLNGVPAARPAVTIESAAVTIAKWSVNRSAWERYEADEITKEEWRAKGDSCAQIFTRYRPRRPHPLTRSNFSPLASSGRRVSPRSAVKRISALWERIEGATARS